MRNDLSAAKRRRNARGAPAQREARARDVRTFILRMPRYFSLLLLPLLPSLLIISLFIMPMPYAAFMTRLSETLRGCAPCAERADRCLPSLSMRIKRKTKTRAGCARADAMRAPDIFHFRLLMFSSSDYFLPHFNDECPCVMSRSPFARCFSARAIATPLFIIIFLRPCLQNAACLYLR